MADPGKTQKLVAARKKLKEFQQKNIKLTKNDENAASSVTTTNSSRHSSISNGNADQVSELGPFENERQPSPFLAYFNGNEQNHVDTDRQKVETRINFFDNLSNNGPGFFDTTPVISQSDDVTSLDYPEVQCRAVYGFYPKEEHPTVSSEDAKRLSEFLGGDGVTSDIDNVENESNKQPQLQNLISMFSDNSSKIPPHQNYDSQLKEYQLKVAELEAKLDQNKNQHDYVLKTELGALQERLQGHVKTIEMYIAENNQLSESLLQNQTLGMQKSADCEELQGRLKASRSRVADLEKELQAAKMEKLKPDQSRNYEAEISRLKQLCEELKQSKDESTEDALELREKLSIKVNENIGLQRELEDVARQLSLAQIKIEQLSVGENAQHDHMQLVLQQKAELAKQILELSQTLKAMSEEKVQTNLQYQNYVHHFNMQISQMANQLEALTTENESLSKREQNLVRHVGELEKRLQSLQEERASIDKNVNGEGKREVTIVADHILAIRKEKEELQEKYEHLCSDQDDLLSELASKKDTIEQLENALERYKVDLPNNLKLLAAIESDKVAASRAVSQNTTLKQELEEMQQAFVRMSNDKLDLTERLSSEQFKSHELQEQLNLLDAKLHTLSDAIEIKDNELTHVRETLAHQNKQLLQNNQLTDRLRHYEAQDVSGNMLQEDLQRAHAQINKLATENLKLKDEIGRGNLVKDNLSDENVEMKEMQTLSESANVLDKEVAMLHLEQKFTDTMEDVANLKEEKFKLEHLVEQLQGETDTIGEYIALYQHQRGVLQQRTQEREEQLERLANDRMNVKNKLEIINSLVKKLVLEKGALPSEILEMEHESTALDERESENNNVGGSQTVGQIIQLLSEIKSSNLVQPCYSLGDFHPCSCCSGQLFTV